MFGLQEMIIIALIILILFGARKLPEMGKGLGQGIREFRRATTCASEVEDDKPDLMTKA